MTVLAGPGPLRERVKAVTDIATAHADDVDAQGKFPAESLLALREARLMGILVAVEDGGEGAGLADVAEVITLIGQSCASTAMVYAMHQIQVACLTFSEVTPELAELRKRIATEQLLLASATTEKGIGGDVRSSSCHVERDGERFTLRKDAPVISYGPWADAIFVTARRSADSPPNDQVLVACPATDLTLTKTTSWNAMGMRGTCSDGFILEAGGPVGYVLPKSYGELSAAIMLPTTHLLWAAVWLGIATSAANKAGAFVRKAARSSPGAPPPAARHLAELMQVVQQMRDVLNSGLARYASARLGATNGTDSIPFALSMNAVKTTSSTLVVEAVNKALLICGLAGYREEGPYRMSRLLRDAHSAALMVSNERIFQHSAQMLLVAKDLG